MAHWPESRGPGHGGRVDVGLNQSQGGICIDTGSASAANTVIPANAAIPETIQNVLSRTPAYSDPASTILRYSQNQMLLSGDGNQIHVGQWNGTFSWTILLDMISPAFNPAHD